MRLMEMYEPSVEGYQDIADDNSKPQWKESRKTKLTLKQIRKLRKMLDVRAYEKAKHLGKVQLQYGPKPEGDGSTPTM